MNRRYILIALSLIGSTHLIMTTARHAAQGMSAGKVTGKVIGHCAGGSKGAEIGSAIVGATTTAIGAAHSDIEQYCGRDLRKFNKSLIQENRLLRRDINYWHAKAEANEYMNSMLREENEQLRKHMNQGIKTVVKTKQPTKSEYINEREYTKKRRCPTCRKKRHPFHKPCLPEDEFAPMPLESDDTEAPDFVYQYVPEEYTSEIGLSSDSIYK